MLNILIVMGVLAVQGPTPASAGGAAAGEDKIKCRSYQEIGSLVKKRKVCKTLADWRKSEDAHQGAGQNLQDGSRGAPSGGE